MATSNIQKAEQKYHTIQKATPIYDDEWVQHPDFHETRKILGKSFSVPGEPICD
jgi:hypothetical protein